MAGASRKTLPLPDAHAIIVAPFAADVDTQHTKAQCYNIFPSTNCFQMGAIV